MDTVTDEESDFRVFETAIQCPQSLVALRNKLLDGEEGTGFACRFIPFLEEHVVILWNQWMSALQSEECNDDHGEGGGHTTTRNNPLMNERAASETIQSRIMQTLSLYNRITEVDPVLNEEIAREGGHTILSRIIRLDAFSITNTEEDQDTLIAIQDIAASIASKSQSFPLPKSPFTKLELHQRLPLHFQIVVRQGKQSEQTKSDDDDKKEPTILDIWINQVTQRQSAQVDVGFVMWPSAVLLAHWLASHPQEVMDKSVLELGAGCGLTGLVVAKLMQQQRAAAASSFSQKQQQQQRHLSTTTLAPSVILSDFNDTVVRNASHNIELNQLQGVAEARKLDFYQQDIQKKGWLESSSISSADQQHLDEEHEQQQQLNKQVDLVLAADIICQPEDAFAAARTIFAAIKSHGKAIVVSANSKHRFGVEKFMEACEELTMICEERNTVEMLDDSATLRHMEQTTGFVQDMELTMYVVRKKREGT